ncbi:MAG: DNA-3-methyladenine glycosylase [Candidatus Paceibacterota bacterium]
MKEILGKEWFNRDAEKVAQELLGKYLICGNIALPITETEAYVGPQDLASHASKGRTKRTEVMFGPPGHWYIYLIYGMYNMLNIVTREKDYPAAVLIRGAGDYDGPGKLTKALGIDRKFNTQEATSESGLWVEDRGMRVENKDIERTSRIGVGYAKEWSTKPFRYVLKKD